METKKIKLNKPEYSSLYRENPEFDILHFNFHDEDAVQQLKFKTKEEAGSIEKLKAYQRLLRLSPNEHLAEKLLSQGLVSAQHIAAIPPKEFVKKYKRTLGLSEDELKKLHQNALDIKARTMLLWGNAVLSTHAPYSQAFHAKLMGDVAQKHFQNLPGYQEMFGNLNYLKCDSCDSIFSPAAYFVDLMRIIDRYITTPNIATIPEGLKLKDRRPDLFYMPLTSENTNGLIPSLAVVNETLAAQVTKALNVTDAELGVASAVYPHNLPVNLPQKNINIYLQELKTSFSKIFEALKIDSEGLAKVYLNVSQEWFEQITVATTDLQKLKKQYGMDMAGETWETDLAIQQTFLFQTSLSFVELTQLLTGHLSVEERTAKFAHNFFINQSLSDNQFVYLSVNNESPSLSTLVNLNDTSVLDRTNRFIRLAKELDWTFSQLNLVLRALNTTTIDPDSVTAIAQFRYVLTSLNISLEVVTVLIHDMNTIGQGVERMPLDMFDQVFNNPFTSNGQTLYRPVYASNPLFKDPVQNWMVNNQNASSAAFGSDRLSASIHCSNDQLTEMGIRIWGDGKIVPLDVPTLSLLYRHSKLFKQLNLSVVDYFTLLDLIQLPKDKAFDLAQILQLSGAAAWLKDAGLSPQEMVFVLTGVPNEQARYSFLLDNVKVLMTSLWNLAPATLTGSASFENNTIITVDASPKIYDYFVSKNVITDLTVAYSTFLKRKTDGALGLVLRMPDSSEMEELNKLLEPTDILAFDDYVSLVLTKKIEGQKQFLAQQISVFIAASNDLTLALLNWATAGENKNSLPLLFTPLNAPGDTDWQPIDDYLKYVSRYELLVSRLLLDAATTQSVVNLHKAYDIDDLSTLTFSNIKSIYQLQQFIKTYQTTNEIIAYFSLPSDTAVDGPKALALSEITQWPVSQIGPLVVFFKGGATYYDDLAGVLSLKKVFDITMTSGTNVSVLIQLGGLNGLPVVGESPVNDVQTPNWSVWKSAEEMVLQSLKAKCNDTEWLSLSRQLKGKTLSVTREAYLKLVVWYLHETYPDIAYARNVSEYLLMDVETSGCSDISYVKQGLLSLQMYMQRCRMGIEIGASTSDIPEIWWEWMMNYRVWEANRKVFLYPENYIDPGLRTNESSIYKELQESLLQSDITSENVRKSYVNYFNGFSDLSNLVDAGNYRCTVADADTPEPTDTIFFFGRTYTKPYIYYYRKCINPTTDNPVWTYWERINVKVNSDYISPLYAFNKLFLFWVELQTVDQSIVRDNNTVNNTVFQSKLYYSFYDFSKEWVQEQYLNDNYNIFSWPDSYISDLTDWINDLGIDFSKNKLFWQKAYPMALKDTQGKDMILMTYGDVFILPSGVTKDPPKPGVPVSAEQEAFNQNLYEAIVRANNAANAGMTGYNVLTPSVLIKPNLQLDETTTILQNILYNTPNPYRSRINTETAMLQMIESQNVIVDNYYGDMGDAFGQFGTISVDLLNHISVSNAYTITLKNHPGSFVFSNGDEAFLSLSQQEVKPISEILRINYDLASSNETDLLTLAYTENPEALEKIKFKFIRIADAAIQPLSNRLFMGGVDSLLTIAAQSPFEQPELPFSRYNASSNVIPPIMPDGAQVDFKGSYGPYYWEVFFHIPFLIAKRLTSNRHFQEAQAWYEYIFNPTKPVSEGLPVDVPEQNKFWYFYPFRIQKALESITDNLKDEAQIAAYNNDPFDPHAIANLRIGAYEKSIVMNYIENILDWADDLFSRDTWETITEAITLYLLAYDLLGNRPEEVGTGDTEKEVVTFQKIEDAYKDQEIPQFLIELESEVHNTTSVQLTSTPFNDIDAVFCVPENDYLLKLWDRIEGQLYKIRHCMNIDGQVRSLALYEPPIDVFQLVSAIATSGGQSPLKIMQQLQGNATAYRFVNLIEKAKNTTGTVMDFGSKLLSALEKNDAEALTLLQSSNQSALLHMMTINKQNQIEVAQYGLEALQASLKNATDKYTKYTTWLQVGLIPNESANLDALAVALGFNIASTIAKTSSSILYSIPQVGSPFAMTYGGIQLGNVADAIGAVADMGAVAANYVANTNQIKGGFKRRDQEWELQAQLAQDDIDQINDSISAQEFQLSINKQDLAIHLRQIDQEQQLQAFYQNKFTNKTLYQWMIGRLSTLYYQMYQLAQEMAMDAQQAFQYELNTKDGFINFGYWDSLKKGLLAGEGLMLALDQMYKSYTDKNDRRLEIEKTVSLIELDPYALIDLKTKGICCFSLTELLFDYDYPEHYCRRIKNISISIPAVVGPYQNFKAILTQKSNKIVLEPSSQTVNYLISGEGKPEDGALICNWRPNQQIALSSGINDSGLFELNFQDERYLPFEGTGAVSEWELKIPFASNRINFESISDVIVKVSYTALDGGADYFKKITALSGLQQYSSSMYYNCNQNFASQWFQFLHLPPVGGIQKFVFSPGKSLVLPHVNNAGIDMIYLQLDVANNASLQSANSFLSLTIGSQPAKELVLIKNYACIRLEPQVKEADYLEDWELSVNMANAPSAILKDGQINPEVLLDIELIVVCDGQVNWQEIGSCANCPCGD
jgi:hypothetical protein